MEAEVTPMASGSSSALDSKGCCAVCGMDSRWTSRMWKCDVCQDYFLCEDCYKGSLDDPELLSAPPEVHHRDHHMSPDVIIFECDGCGSNPIWNLRWRCKVCFDIDLCEACHGRLDALDMPPEHSKEHPMIALEVFCTEMMLKFQPSFGKPVDPQWSYQVQDETASYGFMWVQKKPMSTEESTIIHTLGNAIEGSRNHGLMMEEYTNPSSSFKQALETTQTNRMLDKKHKIFLSHAGAEKDFVEQLYRDLTKMHHFGIFFDKEDASLPKGEPFPSRILDAAKHCELAIVVISHEYFIRKWPMLELTTFVNSQKTRPELKILPIFYKLSTEEFKEQQQSFQRHWTKMRLVCEDEMNDWKEALKVISRTNGLQYDKKVGEVFLRDRIVETIYKRVKPELMWDDSHVQGKPQMQQLIQEKIQMLENAVGEAHSTSSLHMGLLGMGGSGKTTMCNVLYNQMMPHYLGKVCHIEFGSMSMLLLRIKLLRNICELDSSLLQTIDEGQALTLLKIHIPQQRVCLIIDNVTCDNQSHIGEARTLLQLPFKDGSLILVTSRSATVLENLKIETRLTMKVPSLTREEAKALFSHHAGCDISSLTGTQMEIMENFVERCNFNVKGMASKEYLPLALKVLGTRVGSNVEEWPSIKIDFKHHENENTHPIFSILRSSFDDLNFKYQRIFLDIVLYSSNPSSYMNMVALQWQMRCLYGEADKKFSLHVVNILQAKSLVEYYDVENGTIYIHDLYCEFVRMEVEKKGLQHSPRCCLSRGSKHQHIVQERRVHIHDHHVSHIRKDILSCTICSEAELLSIAQCTNLVSIDVPGMQNLKTFVVHGGCPQLKNVNLEGAINLKDLTWSGFVGEYPDLISLESLEGLWLQNEEAQSPRILHGCLDFSRSSNLECLYLSYLPLHLLNLNQAVLLKMLCLMNCEHLERLEGLEALVQLEDLRLLVCSSLVEFPSLANFPSLEVFYLEGARKLKAIHGIASLTALRKLSLVDGRELEELPGIEACTRLCFLRLYGTSIGDCSWISMMEDLTFVDICGTKIRFVPNCSGLSKLSNLWLNDCQALESIGIVSTMSSTFPKSLKIFSAENCRSLNAVLQFHHESALDYLDIEETCVEDVSGVACCKQLQKLYCGDTRITSLPDLSNLTRLEALDVSGCKLLTRMDNITSLPALDSLWVSGCTSLSALPNLRSSTRLMRLDLFDCPLLDPNSVILPCGSSVDMEVEDGVDDYSDHSVQESENLTSAVTPDFQEPEPAHNQRSFATFINLVAKIASWCGGFGAD